ncbi:SDR family oxidoreductase [Zavarzinia sp.]|uniref:SDR family oxidoreductase n=1 Tax=Zavarzinia sp. TaxID=2027920 RepID=UPI003BB79A15
MITDHFNPGLLEGRTAFITGGGSGVNLAIGKAFAALGARIGICGRTRERLESGRIALEALGAEVFTAVADVRDADAVQAALDACRLALGPVDILVCGAAGNFVAPAEAISAKGFRTVVEIDLLGTFHATRAAFPQLRETKGNILFVSGGQSFVPFAFQAHVGAAKAGIDNLMRNLALEWGRYGIRCNSIVPGPVKDTEGMKRLGGPEDPDLWREMTPLGRMAEQEEIGQAAAFLVSPLASYISGAGLRVDGGQNLTGSTLFNAAIARALAAGPGDPA